MSNMPKSTRGHTAEESRAMMNDLDFTLIRAMALTLLRDENETLKLKRDLHAARVRLGEETDELKLTPASFFAANEPRPAQAKRLWAMSVAPLLTYAQWDELAEKLDDVANRENWRRGGYSFMEWSFSGLTLKDGTLIVA